MMRAPVIMYRSRPHGTLPRLPPFLFHNSSLFNTPPARRVPWCPTHVPWPVLFGTTAVNRLECKGVTYDMDLLLGE